MSAMLVVPAVVFLIGGLLAMRAISRTTGAARELGQALDLWRPVRPALVTVRADADELRARIRQLPPR